MIARPAFLAPLPLPHRVSQAAVTIRRPQPLYRPAYRPAPQRPSHPALRGTASASVMKTSTFPSPLGPIHLRLEDLGGRRRRISGSISIPSPPARVWDVLTTYSAMSSYMPNIVSSSTQTARDGTVLLDQVGIISRKLGLKSRMLMSVAEDDGVSIGFSKVEGRDFTEFEGKYFVKREGDDTRLEYELTAVPMPLFPVALVERKIIKEVPRMLESVREESMQGNVVPIS